MRRTAWNLIHAQSWLIYHTTTPFLQPFITVYQRKMNVILRKKYKKKKQKLYINKVLVRRHKRASKKKKKVKLKWPKKAKMKNTSTILERLGIRGGAKNLLPMLYIYFGRAQASVVDL